MNPWIALYVKELKGVRVPAIVLLSATLAVGVWAVSDAYAEVPGPVFLALGLPFFSCLVLPALFVNALSSEWDGRTHYQLLSLPVPRSAFVLAKLAAVVTLGLAVFLLATGCAFVALNRLVDIGFLPALFAAGLTGAGWWVVVCGYWSVALLLLGLGGAAAAVRLQVSRFPGLVTALVFLVGLWAHGRVAAFLLPRLQSVVGRIHLSSDPAALMPASDANGLLIASAVSGALFLAMGLALFETRVESR